MNESDARRYAVVSPVLFLRNDFSRLRTAFGCPVCKGANRGLRDATL